MAEVPTASKNVVHSPELESERMAILQLLTQGEDAQWQIGMHYNKIVEGRLAEEAGYKHARDFFAKSITGIPQSTLSRCGQIAKAFPEESAKKYGVSPLATLLTYEKLAEAKLPSGDPADVPIAVPQDSGSTTTRRFADCTRAELNAAIHHLKQPVEPIPEEDTAIINRLQERLHEALGENPPIAMKARNTRVGTVINFAVPIEHLENLRDVLSKEVGGSVVPEQETAAYALGHTAAAGIKAIGKLLGKH